MNNNLLWDDPMTFDILIVMMFVIPVFVYAWVSGEMRREGKSYNKTVKNSNPFIMACVKIVLSIAYVLAFGLFAGYLIMVVK